MDRTFDRRTNIVLIDQDLLGKTSLRRYLRGESFVRDEVRTNGIEAEVVAWEFLRSSKERSDRPQLFNGEGKKTRGSKKGDVPEEKEKNICFARIQLKKIGKCERKRKAKKRSC